MSKSKAKLKDVRLSELYDHLSAKSAADKKVMTLMRKIEQLEAPYKKAILEDWDGYLEMLVKPEAFADRKKIYDLLEEARNVHAAKSWKGNFLTNLAISFHLEKIASIIVSGNAKLFKK